MNAFLLLPTTIYYRTTQYQTCMLYCKYSVESFFFLSGSFLVIDSNSSLAYRSKDLILLAYSTGLARKREKEGLAKVSIYSSPLDFFKPEDM